MLRLHFSVSVHILTAKVMIDILYMKLYGKTKPSDPKRETFPNPVRTTMKRRFHSGRRYGEIGRNLALTFPKKRNHFHGSKNTKTYFYVCLFKWKTRESSTNNKLWWFQNDSTDFSRFSLLFFPPSETTVNEPKTKTNLSDHGGIFATGK